MFSVTFVIDGHYGTNLKIINVQYCMINVKQVSTHYYVNTPTNHVDIKLVYERKYHFSRNIFINV